MDKHDVIRFTDVCFSYGKREVLHNVSFSITPQTFTGVVGPNGGGKTTLLKLMLGLLKPDRGTVHIFGENPARARVRIGYVMQHMQYDEKFPATVRDIVLMGRTGKSLFGFFNAQDKIAASHALDMVEMERFSAQPFAALSGGQQQRVLIAQALVGEPEVLLLDEPTANIDSEGEKNINALLVRLAGKLTVITVSHNVNMVVNTVSHVLCVNHTATLGPIGALHPDGLINATNMTMLHHGAACQVFDASHVHATPHKASQNTEGSA